MQREEQLHIAKLSSLIGGVLLLAGSALTGLALLAFVAGATAFFGADLVPIAVLAFALFIILAGLVTGGVTLVAAYRFEGPNGKAWGLATLIAGIIAAVTGGGFFIGALAAIIGGALVFTLPDA